MSACDDKHDEFLKNEYILNLNELIMTRNYVYKEKTYQKYRLTDLSVKKSNTYVRNIYEEDGKILTHKHGYPQFYTQIQFEKDKQEIFMKTVLNIIFIFFSKPIASDIGSVLSISLFLRLFHGSFR